MPKCFHGNHNRFHSNQLPWKQTHPVQGFCLFSASVTLTFSSSRFLGTLLRLNIKRLNKDAVHTNKMILGLQLNMTLCENDTLGVKMIHW